MNIDHNNQVKDEVTTGSGRVRQRFLSPLAEVIQFAVIALIIVVPIRVFIAQPFIVSGASMQETFNSGEYLIVDQVTYRFHEPQRGDVIVFRYPRDPSKFFIKRIIGLPGDKIEIKESVITITNDEHPEGWVLHEPYIRSMKPQPPRSANLGPGDYFVLGDNRDQSSDSRTWGILRKENIIGRAVLRLFPVERLGLMPGVARLE